MQKALFIYNPRSGRNRNRKPDFILNRLTDRGFQTQTFYLSSPDDDQRLIRTLNQDRFDLVIISGGDGSINYVVNVLIQNQIDLPVGIIPAGTSNDLARNLRIPPNQAKAADLIAKGKTSVIDVGLVNHTVYFLSSCSGGLFTDISYKTEGRFKQCLGPLAYYLNGVRELSRVDPFSLTIETDSGTVEEDVLLFFILNGPNVAGLTDLVKEATPADGLLHLVLIKKCTLIDLAGLFFNILERLSLRGNNKVKILSAPEFRIKSNREIALSIDGEKSGNLPVNLTVETKKLTVFSALK